MRDINEYTHMTREEFIVEVSGKLSRECPSDYDLKDLTCGNKCKECWKQAIKDIKFKRENNMEKKDLKNGMVVETKMGTRYLVVNDEFINNNNWISFRSVNNDLTSDSDECFDIVKVYSTTGSALKWKFHDNKIELIWQRSEVDWSKVEMDTKIEVKNENGQWYKRHFASFENRKVYAYNNGESEFTKTGLPNGWEYFRLYKED